MPPALISALCLAALLAAPPSAPHRVGEKTLTRIYDPVIVSTGALAALPDHQTADLRVARLEGGRPVAIPFQFDQRDRHGEVVIDGPAQFTFDSNDELVFMASDTGDRADPAVWPPDCDAVVEITVTDPSSNQRGWAYVLHCKEPAPVATVPPYVTYDRGTNQARSPYYAVDYAPSRNYFTALRIGDGAGDMSANLLRQTRMRGSPTLSLLFTDVTLEFTEQTSIVAVDGIKNGPVRAVRRARLSVDLGPLVPTLPNGVAYTYHYRSAFVTPTRFGVPGMILRILRDFHFEDVVEFDPAALPMHYYDGANPGGVTLNGSIDAPVETSVDHDWWVHSDDAGAVLNAFVIPKRWQEWGIVRGTVVRADARSGPTNAAGYSLLNMTRLREGGDYDLLQATLILPHSYRPGDENDAMAMLRAPLQPAAQRVR